MISLRWQDEKLVCDPFHHADVGGPFLPEIHKKDFNKLYLACFAVIADALNNFSTVPETVMLVLGFVK